MDRHQNRHSQDRVTHSPEKGRKSLSLPSSPCLYSNVEGKKIILSRCLAVLHLRKMHGIKFLKS